MIVPDVNLLVYAFSAESPEHKKAKNWLQETLSGNEPVGMAWLVSVGFLRIVTNPRIFAHHANIEDAIERVKGWYAHPLVSPLVPGVKHLEILNQLLLGAGQGGNLVNDAHLAALAMEYDAVIHSHDADFAKFRGLKWHNPLQKP